jgi:hypothetical protein
LPRLELVTLVRVCAMETSMHGIFEKSGEAVKRIYRNWGIGIFALPLLIVIAVAGLAMTHLDASSWIPEAAQTEFTGAYYGPVATPSKQLAQPVGDIRSVRAN